LATRLDDASAEILELEARPVVVQTFAANRLETETKERRKKTKKPKSLNR